MKAEREGRTDTEERNAKEHWRKRRKKERAFVSKPAEGAGK
jgi:hypothetical protein